MWKMSELHKFNSCIFHRQRFACLLFSPRISFPAIRNRRAAPTWQSDMSNLEQFDSGSVVSALGDDQLSAGGNGDGVGRSNSVVLGQQMTHEASGESQLRHAVVVAIGDD